MTAGETRFETSCKATVAGMFDHSLSLLHARAYAEAASGFRMVTHSDVDCAIGAWGTAMAQWGRWEASGARDALDLGRQALAMSASMRHASARERRYLAAVAQLYDGAPERPRAGAAYADAMAALSKDFPDDQEAAIFSARALIARPEERVVALAANRRRAEAMLGGLPVEHPGVVHDTLAAGSDPARLATAARHAAHVLPATSYALLLPSRAFARTGEWQAVVGIAARAADAARRDGEPADELRAQDVQVEALLQVGRDADAAAIARRVTSMTLDLAGPGTRTAEAGSARLTIPARIALERGDWAEATAVRAADGATDAQSRLAALVRAIGAARLGRAARARQELGATAPAPLPLIGLAAVAEAWTLVAEGQTARAVAVLQGPEALAADDVFPPLVPVLETLGEIRLQSGDAAGALASFERALASAPGRLRALDGAALAAARAGRVDVARNFLTRLVEQAGAASSPIRPSIQEARNRLEALKSPR